MIPYRLIFLDLDGTLVGATDEVSPRNLAALNAASAAGCTIVICTARTPYMAKRVGDQWSGHGFGIFVNGAIITEWETGEVLQKRTIDPLDVSTAAAIARDAGLAALYFGTQVETDGGFAVYTDGACPLHPAWERINGRRVHVIQSGMLQSRDGPADLEESNIRPGACANDPATALAPVSLGVYGDMRTVRAVADAWREALGQTVAIWDAVDDRYEGWCAYITGRGVDKSTAARFVAQMLMVPRERTLAIGDHLNDLGLVQWAGLGIAMGDGHPDLVNQAGRVTGAFADDGVAEAIEQFVLSA